MSTVSKDHKANPQAALELLYRVSHEIAASVDLPILLERVLYFSMQTIGAINGSIIALDDTGHPVASALFVEQEAVDYSPDQLQATLDHGLAGWVVKNLEAALITNTSQDERWLHRPDDDEEATGAKSVVSVPFLAQDRLAGVITLVHPIPNFFEQSHLALIQAIADQSGIAVLNARLLADSRKQARIMKALAESATSITGTLHLDDVLQQILKQTSHVLEVEAVSLALMEKDNQTLKYFASTSSDAQSVVGKRLKVGQGIAGWVAQHQQGVIIPNAYADGRFDKTHDEQTGFKCKAIICNPIFSEGAIIGVIEGINPKSGRFDADALTFLDGISSLAGTAIRHATLFEALEAAHKRYHDLFEGSINSILITDLNAQIVEVNQETVVLSQFSKEDLKNTSVEIIHDVDYDQLGMEFENISEAATLTYESNLHTQTGTEIPIICHVQLVLIEGQTFIQWVFRDNTERKELDQMREDLLSMIYHDLRSPLANVVSSLDVLNTMVEFNDNPAIKSLFDIAVRSTERIQRLTNSLLDLNRLEAGHPVVDTEEISPNTLLQDALEAVYPIINNKKLNLTTEVPEDIENVVVDGDMIRRVLINILENAIKFTPPKGKIRVGVVKENNWIRIWIEDTGPGIPQEKRLSIFDKYTRLHGKGAPKGFGLGLAYCRLAVEGHGGQIWIEDAEIGGSHFTFTLPISAQN